MSSDDGPVRPQPDEAALDGGGERTAAPDPESGGAVYDWAAEGVFDEPPSFETQATITASPHGPSWDLELSREGHEPVSITGVSDEALLVLVGDTAAEGLISQRSEPRSEPDDG